MEKSLLVLLLIADILEPILLPVVLAVILVIAVVLAPFILYNQIRLKLKRCRRRRWANREIDSMTETAMIVYMARKWNVVETKEVKLFERKLTRLGMIAGRIPVTRAYMRCKT
jgi:hypothetical protein